MSGSDPDAQLVPGLFRTLFDALPTGVIVLDHNGTIVATNPAALAKLKRPLNAVQGCLEDLVDERGEAIAHDQLPAQVVLRTGEPAPERVAAVRSDDPANPIWLKISAVPHRSVPNAGPSGVILLIDDATDGHSNERQQQLWVNAFQHCSHGIAIGVPGVEHLHACNAALAETRGRTIEEMLHTPLLDTYLAEDRDIAIHGMAESDRTGRAKFVARINRPDGETRTLLMDLVTVRDEQGLPAYRVATQLDITEQQRIETLNAQLQRLYATLSQINQMIVRVDSERELFESTCRLSVEFGRFRLAWIGLYDADSGEVRLVAASEPVDLAPINVREASHRDSVIGAAVRTGQITHGGPTDALETVRRAPQERVEWQACAAVPLHMDQRVIGVLALYASEVSLFTSPEELNLLTEMGLDLSYALDMLERETHRRQTTAALASSEAALKHSQAVAHVGHWTWDTCTNQLTWSDEMYRIFGVEPSNMLDLEAVIAQAIHPDDREVVRQANERVVTEQSPGPIEYRVLHPDGSVHMVWAQPSEVVQDERGSITRLTGIVQDITKQKQAEARIREQTERLKVLAEASRAFASAGTDIHAVLDQVAKRVAEALDGHAHIRLITDDGEWLELAAVQDRDESMRQIAIKLLGSGPVRVRDTVIGAQVFGAGQSVFLPKTTSEALAQQVVPELKPTLAHFPVHSLLSVPLIAQDKRIGVLVLARYRQEQASFHTEDLRLLEDLADRAALAILNARLFTQLMLELSERRRSEQALRESEERLQTVFKATPDAIFITDPEGRIIDVNPGAVERYGYSRGELLQMSARDFAPPGLEERSLEELEQALMSRLPTERTSRRKDGSEIQEEAVLRPFMLQGRACVLASVRDISERVRAQERLQLQLQRLKALRTIDVMITSNLDIRLTLDVLLDQVTVQLNVDAAAILLFNEGLQTLEYAAGRGFRSHEIEQSRLRLGQGYAGQAGLERRLVVMPNLRESGAAGFVRSNLLLADSFMGYAGVPLVAKGRLVGVLEVFHRSPLAVDVEWRDFLETLAGQAAIALDDAHLFSDLQRSNTELRLAYDATIEGWSRAMDLRDKETEGHTQRVTELTLTLAQAAGMTGDQIAHVRRGALLHDIGKLGVPDRILLKTDALTDEEWATMRMHPQYAYDMLSSIDYLRPALDIPYCHHEKWDGTGYPRGLKGEQIPLAARIFMVADVWDALRSDRPYRASWSEERVRAHIREQAGSHFDPKAVDLFFQVIPISQRDPRSDPSPGGLT